MTNLDTHTNATAEVNSSMEDTSTGASTGTSINNTESTDYLTLKMHDNNNTTENISDNKCTPEDVGELITDKNKEWLQETCDNISHKKLETDNINQTETLDENTSIHFEKNSVSEDKLDNNSDDDDDINSSRCSRKQSKLQIDSDSDSPNIVDSKDDIKDSPKIRRKSKLALVSDSDDSGVSDNESLKQIAGENKTQSAYKSSSNDEEDPTSQKKNKKSRTLKSSGFCSDSDDSALSDTEETTQKAEEQKDGSSSENDSILNDEVNTQADTKGQDESDSDNDAVLNDDGDSTHVRPRKERKSKTISKMVIKETKSEQQRLLREKSLRIPYHTPEIKPLKEFLQRVPKLEKTVSQTRTPPVESSKNKTLTDIFKVKPRLSLPNEINFESDDENSMDIKDNDSKKAKADGLQSFMKRFQKHADYKKKTPEPTSKNKSPALSSSTKVTVKARFELKDQLKCNILKKRQEFHEDLEKQLSFYNEENYVDGEGDAMEYDGDTDESESDEEHPYKNADSDDGGEEIIEKENNPIDSNSNKEEVHDKLSSNSDNETTLRNNLPAPTQVDFYCEDTSSTISSFLPPGQGEPTFSKIIPQNQMTPFTKLLKIGLLDSASKDGIEVNHIPSLSLPNEDTQDLYRDEKSYIDQDDNDDADEDDENVGKFSLGLDEETQFDNVLNTQGFFLQDSKRERKEAAKKLFDDDMKIDSSMSMTQVLGFCSGSFTAPKGDNRSAETDGSKGGPLTQALGLDNNEGSSMTQALGFLSGKFTEEEGSKDDIEGVHKLDEEGEPTDLHDDKETAYHHNDTSGDKDEESGDEKEKGGDEHDENSDFDEENKENIEFTRKSKKVFHLSSEDEEEKEEENQLSEDEHNEVDEENDIVQEEKQVGWKKNLFYENEAELSGSDVGSDDEVLGSDFDEYEVDEDAERDYTSTSKLKKQVHKIHQRKMLDEDRKELRLLQELYLEDGDLGGGVKRKRNFRWRNIDKEGFTADTSDHSEDENGDQIDTVDIVKRMDRLERDHFIQEAQEKESSALDECSQTVLEKISSQDLSENNRTINIPQVRHSYPQAKKFKRSGSFLGGSKTVANEIVTSSNPGTRSGKSFVFQAATDHKDKTKKEKSERISSSSSPSIKPTRNVHRLDKLKAKSVFNLM